MVDGEEGSCGGGREERGKESGKGDGGVGSEGVDGVED